MVYNDQGWYCECICKLFYDYTYGRLAQLVRAPALQAGGPRFEPATAHHIQAD